MRVAEISAGVNPAVQVGSKTLGKKVFEKKTFLQDVISFKASTKAIEESLLKNYAVKAHFNSNTLVAECTEKTVKLMSKIFGRNSLPKKVVFGSFQNMYPEEDNFSVLGMHLNDGRTPNNRIYFNSDQNCFKTRDKLNFGAMADRVAWYHPTGHYLSTFVHEFGHSAHYKNLFKNGHPEVMGMLSIATIPTSIGRLIAKFKLGRYSANSMNELMAERITKDVCKKLDKSGNFIGDKEDLNYSNIFDREWQYRYSCPQSYIDYYIQQVWNGDIEGANRVANDAECYLKELEAVKLYAPVLETVKEKEVVKENSLLTKMANALTEMSEAFTEKLNERNKIKLKKRL